MKLEDFSHWAQIGATVFVGLGLFLIVFEMRQAKDLSNVEMVSVALTEIIEQNRNVGGERFADAIAKACLAPDELTDSELVVLDAYFQTIYWSGTRVAAIEETGAFGTDLEETITKYYQAIAQVPYGRWWLEKRSRDSSTIRTDLVPRAIELGKDNDCTSFYTEMREVYEDAA